jgi:hypothetical protein
VTNVHVDKVVYKNVRVNNAVTTVNHDTFVRGKPADARVNENPFLTEKVHVGRPPIKPEKTSAMPVVREIPQKKRPPEPVKRVNVRELKEQRPMVKSKEASVLAPETRPREMPLKEGEAKPTPTKTERAKELRQPSRRVGEPTPSVPAEKRARQRKPAPAEVQEQKQRAPADKGRSQPAPSEPAVRTPKETRSPERGSERRIESRSPGKVMEQTRPPEGVQPKTKEVIPPEKGMPQTPEIKAPEKSAERPRPPRNREKGA